MTPDVTLSVISMRPRRPLSPLFRCSEPPQVSQAGPPHSV